MEKRYQVAIKNDFSLFLRAFQGSLEKW